MQVNNLRSRGFIDDIVLPDENYPESYFKLCHRNYLMESRFDNLIPEIDRKIKEKINLTHEERRRILHSLKFRLAMSRDKIIDRCRVAGDGYCCSRSFFVCCHHAVYNRPMRDVNFNNPEEAAAYLNFLEHLSDTAGKYPGSYS